MVGVSRDRFRRLNEARRPWPGGARVFGSPIFRISNVSLPQPNSRRNDRRTIDEPIEIAKFWKSGRNRKNSIVIAIKQYEGHTFLDCRVFGTNSEGQTVPTAKGITVGMLRMSEFVRAVQKAHAKAIELGLINDGAGE
jgi:hypothetical protein